MKAIKPPIPKGHKKTSPPPARGIARLGAWWKSWRRSTRAAEARVERVRAPPPPAARVAASRRAHLGPGGHLEITFHPLAVARAHDGALRGLADPTLLLAAFAIQDDRRTLLPVLRSVVRYRLPGVAPCTAAPDVLSVVSTLLRRSTRVLIVATLWEENSGVDVQALASSLERPDDLHLVDLSSPAPEVASAVEAVGDLRAPPLLDELRPRGILVQSRDVAQTRSDTWVGGAAVVVATNHGRPADHRVSLQSADGRQDWTLAFATQRV